MNVPRHFFTIRVSLALLFILSSVLPIGTPFSPGAAIAASQPAPVVEPQRTIEKEPVAEPSFVPGPSLSASTWLAPPQFPPQSLPQSPPRQTADSSPYVSDFALPAGVADIALGKEVTSAQFLGLPLRVEASGLDPDQQLEIQAATLEPTQAKELSPFGVAFRLSVKEPAQETESREREYRRHRLRNRWS